ncbi:MAG: type II secretion system protein GspF [Deltaproteobacteria bacterium]|nr:MAG: type II secretion system protein GspF [Deltaproteobacteria bacterium]
MPVYEYTGVNSTGKKVRGVFDAESARALRDQLRAQGIFLTTHNEGKAKRERKRGEIHFENPLRDRVSLRDVAVMTRQLGTLQRAGIPLVECLTALVDQTENEALKRVISDVRQKVNEGSALATAMGDHPKVFTPLYVNMIRAGESSGNLDVVLLRLTDFLDDQVRLRGDVSAALFYPVAMLVITLLIVGVLMVVVVPRVTQLFEDQGQALPLLTTILIGFSQLLGRYWWLMGMFIAGAVVAFRRWKATPDGREKWDRFTLRVPVFGSLQRRIAVSRFSKTLSTMLASGVPLLTALDIIKNILGNSILIRVVEQARLNIREGESIAGPLRRSGEFPPMVTHMIAVGERTGELETMLGNVAEAYDYEVQQSVKTMTGLLQPVLIVVMGVMVGGIVFAILLPILRMNEGIVM